MCCFPTTHHLSTNQRKSTSGHQEAKQANQIVHAISAITTYTHTQNTRQSMRTALKAKEQQTAKKIWRTTTRRAKKQTKRMGGGELFPLHHTHARLTCGCSSGTHQRINQAKSIAAQSGGLLQPRHQPTPQKTNSKKIGGRLLWTHCFAQKSLFNLSSLSHLLV